jgi:hypothetical protein
MAHGSRAMTDSSASSLHDGNRIMSLREFEESPFVVSAGGHDTGIFSFDLLQQLGERLT